MHSGPRHPNIAKKRRSPPTLTHSPIHQLILHIATTHSTTPTRSYTSLVRILPRHRHRLLLAMMFSYLLLLLTVLSASTSSVVGQSCPSPQIATCDAGLQSTAVPTPWFRMDFTTQPAASPFATNVPWSATDSSEPTGCYAHPGVVNLQGGGPSDGTNPHFIDIFNSSSPNAMPGTGNVLPGLIGGASAGSVAAGTAGWTIELTWKPTLQLTWAKILNIGAGPGTSCFQYEWNGGNQNTQFTQYDVTQTAGYYTIIGTTALNQWYHGVVVMQQVTPTIGAQAQSSWYVYLNGNLTTTNYGAYQYYPQAVTRQFAYLGRSLWNGDSLYQGLIDSFRIYNYALVQSQVSALFQSAMGPCTTNFVSSPATPASITPNIPLPMGTAPPATAYDVEFTTTPAPSGVSPLGYQWLAQDQDDVQCGLNSVHQGLVYLSDQTQVSETDNIGQFTYVDLGATGTAWAIAPSASSPAGPLAQSGVLATTTGSVSAGTAGFSLEITFKPIFSTQWAKLIDFGSTRSNGGNCVNDIVFGWDSANTVWQLDVCDANANQWQIYDVGGVQPGTQGGFVSGSWYHTVITFQQLPNGLSNWYVFVNNVLVSTMTNTFYPTQATRQNLWLGRSGWGDTLWSGEIDYFRIYQQALGPNQVSTLFAAAMGTTGAQACVYTTSTTPNIPPTALFFSATFDTDPRGVNGVPSNANYSWTNTESSDVVGGVHQGILVLNGCTPGNCGGNYVNLSAASGVNSIGTVLPNWGGSGTGSFDQGTVGWSFELTWKAYSQQTWAKLMDFGDGYSGGQWEALFGWNSGNQYFTVTTTNLNNLETSVGQATPTINYNTWYHTVWVIQSATGSTSAANFFIYTNGALTGQANGGINNGNPNTYFPPLVNRASQNLGKSNWGDNYFLGELDTFRVYSIALNPNQVNTLYEAASNPGGVKTNFSCMGAGFDMSAVGNQDYTLSNYNGYNWVVHPCGYIDVGTCAPGANMCQSNNVVSYWEPSLNPILWQRITGGVQMSITDGAQCGSATFGRTSIIRFLCSETAQVPYLSEINEVVTCTYVAIIQTAAACQVANPNLITAVGEPFASPMCGGGLYDLSSLNLNDLFYSGGGYSWFIRPCQTVGNANCSSVQPTSFCQVSPNNNPPQPYSVANYVGSASVPTVYTLTQQNGNYGMTMQIQDGTICANQFPRVGILTFVCDTTATTPVVSSIVESPIIFCHYTATIRTSVVCGSPASTTGGLTGGNTQLAPTLTNGSPSYASGTGPTCYGAGFDVSASNIDMFYQQYGGYTYYVHPCGNFQNKMPCAAGVSMCQAANDGSGSAYVASRWNASAPSWLQMPNGVQMTIATGDGCGSTAQARYAVYNFVCDTSATTPQLSYVYEIEECHYEAYIATVQACTYYSGLIASKANVGSTFLSNTCGGGVYPLGPISSTELYQNASASSPFSYVVRPCGNVQNPSCAAINPTSFCQYQGQPPAISLPYNAATWSPNNAFNQWQVTSNGIILTVQDGTVCPVINNGPRTGIFVFICNATATTAWLAGVQEIEVCHYTATIHTNLVCTNQLLIQPSTSSTGGNVVTTSTGTVITTSTGTTVIVTGNSSTSNSLSGGKLAAAIVVPIIGALLLACLCFVLGRAMSGGGKSSKMESGVSRGNTSHQPHYDEPSQAAGEQSTNTGVEMA